MIFEMGTLYGSDYTFQNFGQQVLTKKLFFCYILVKNSLKTAKNGGGVGVLRYGVWGVHIWVKEGPKDVFDPGRTKTDVTIILFS